MFVESNKKVWWKCKDSHEWRATIARRVKGPTCPHCSGRHKK
ncbi:zinc-ribbon domain-containing protein [Cytobacillus firmus]